MFHVLARCAPLGNITNMLPPILKNEGKHLTASLHWLQVFLRKKESLWSLLITDLTDIQLTFKINSIYFKCEAHKPFINNVRQILDLGSQVCLEMTRIKRMSWHSCKEN